jgi:hypothetical protein
VEVSQLSACTETIKLSETRGEKYQTKNNKARRSLSPVLARPALKATVRYELITEGS